MDLPAAARPPASDWSRCARRKQYRYHPDWAQVRGDGKFERLVAFGKALPRLRRRLRSDLARSGFPREKVLAIVVALMADTLVRVGNEEYARSNRSYGLTHAAQPPYRLPRRRPRAAEVPWQEWSGA